MLYLTWDDAREQQTRKLHMDYAQLGRMVLAYPELPADLLAGRPLQSKRVCRTFSDCTTAPRNALPSGCYPLDDYYGKSDAAVQLKQVKKGIKSGA